MAYFWKKVKLKFKGGNYQKFTITCACPLVVEVIRLSLPPYAELADDHRPIGGEIMD